MKWEGGSGGDGGGRDGEGGTRPYKVYRRALTTYLYLDFTKTFS